MAGGAGGIYYLRDEENKCSAQQKIIEKCLTQSSLLPIYSSF